MNRSRALRETAAYGVACAPCGIFTWPVRQSAIPTSAQKEDGLPGPTHSPCGHWAAGRVARVQGARSANKKGETEKPRTHEIAHTHDTTVVILGLPDEMTMDPHFRSSLVQVRAVRAIYV